MQDYLEYQSKMSSSILTRSYFTNIAISNLKDAQLKNLRNKKN